MFAGAPSLTPISPQTEGLLFRIWFKLNGGAAAQEIDIDTISDLGGPKIEFILSVEGGGSIHPGYVDCGASDIVITGAGYLCGDANSDQKVNIIDAVYIIRYVFQGGNPPIPMAAGDTNCDGNVNASDAVALINYIFIGGHIPCDADGDGIRDC